MSESWKIVGNLCRCCHSEGSLLPSLSVSSSEWNGLVYSDMMKICFDINLPLVEGPLGPVTYTICKQCIIKLEDATLFRKQVLKCEERFMNVYNKNIIVADLEPVVVKEEEEVSFTEENAEEIQDDLLNGDDEEQDCPEVANESEDNWLSSDDDFEDQIHNENSNEDEFNKPLIQFKTEKATREDDVCEQDKNKSIFRLKYSDFKVVDDAIVCQHCQKKYTQKKTLTKHVRTVHYSIPEYICSICNEGLMTSTSLIIHKLEKHKLDHRFKCNACSAVFNSRLQLNSHKNSFHMLGVKVYKCNQCEFKAIKSDCLYRHKQNHRNVKEFKCRFCKKAFLRRQTMVMHERIHTGDRRKVCKVCSQAFVQKASLTYHMTKYHPGVDI